MLYIAVDTSTVLREGLAFGEAAVFDALAGAVEDGNVKLLLLDLVDREVRKNVRERVGVAVNQIKKQQSILGGCDVFDFSAVVAALDPNAIERELIRQWDELLVSLDPTKLAIADVPASLVMDDYFAQRPPFGPGKQKEFPDAFAIARLRAYARENGVSIHVISEDNDWKRACDGRVLIAIERVAVALTMIPSSDELERRIREFLVSSSDGLRDSIRGYLSDLPCSMSEDYDVDVEAIRVVTVEAKLNSATLMYFRGDEADVHVYGTAVVEVDATVPNYGDSPRDGGDYAMLVYDSVTVTREVDFEADMIVVSEGIMQPSRVEKVRLSQPRSLNIDWTEGHGEVRYRSRWWDEEERGVEGADDPAT